MSSETFGTKLRSLRIRRGVSLNEISASTKLSVDLWESMERGDFSAWPKGLYARAYIRDYANIIGIDPDVAVDDFCRLLPFHGDRRRETLVRGQADIVGHRFAPGQDQLPAGVREDRRRRFADNAESSESLRYTTKDLRIAAAVLDQGLVIALASAIGMASPRHFWLALSLIALVYHAAGVVAAGCSPAAWAIRSYMKRQPRGTTRGEVFRPLPHTIDQA